ncbi:ceramide kinase [Ranunculus cassubicifolius]
MERRIESDPILHRDGDNIASLGMISNLYLDHAGEVVLTLNSDKLFWKFIEPIDKERNASFCFGINLASKSESEVNISDVYAVEFIGWGLIHESALSSSGGLLLGRDFEMYRFTVHGYRRSNMKRSHCVLVAYTFGHKDLQTCQAWVDQITAFINNDVSRPKNILVFVHPLSGKGNGRRTWETVAPIFSRAKVKTKVTITERAGQAFDVMTSITDIELNSYDGVVSVGGDGFFNEIMNGLLRSRHKAPYPPAPDEIMHSGSVSRNTAHKMEPETSHPNEAEYPLLHVSEHDRLVSSSYDENATFSFPSERFRFGIIPAGSTDAIVICTTGTRDPITSALHIVLGKRVSLDIAQVVRWKTTKLSTDAPSVRYAASFAGYGFYGDVIKESENLRWMGPKRYDYAGTKVFLKHRSYEAEVAHLQVDNELTRPERIICRVNCSICSDSSKTPTSGSSLNWLRSKGRYLSVGAAVMSNRNGKAPDGLVADAHLSDGFLHLILVKDCPRSFYLWHLTQLAKKGGNPLNFKFVEHHKTRVFTFKSLGDESVWNLDGEILEAHQLSAQVFRGLVSLFASGPEV